MWLKSPVLKKLRYCDRSSALSTVQQQWRLKETCCTKAKQLTRTASYEMHGSRTRNVHITQLVEEAMFSPCPACRHAVHYGVQEREQAIRLEVAPAGNPHSMRSNVKGPVHSQSFCTTAAAVPPSWWLSCCASKGVNYHWTNLKWDLKFKCKNY
jgi:hypothetical protein